MLKLKVIHLELECHSPRFVQFTQKFKHAQNWVIATLKDKKLKHTFNP